MSEFTPGLFWHGYKEGAPGIGVVCSREGRHGNDIDALRQGGCAVFPGNWPGTISQDLALIARVLIPGMCGPFGETTHHNLLDGVKVLMSYLPDGTAWIQHCFPAWTGPETMGRGGAQGEVTYVSGQPDRG